MVLPDGTYTFTNVKYPSYQLTLSSDGNIVGSIGSNQPWFVRNNGGATTIRNVTTPLYASVLDGNVQPGVNVIGSPIPFNWVVQAVPEAKNGEVYFTASDGSLVWTLLFLMEGTQVVIEPIVSKLAFEAAQWIPSRPY